MNPTEHPLDHEAHNQVASRFQLLLPAWLFAGSLVASFIVSVLSFREFNAVFQVLTFWDFFLFLGWEGTLLHGTYISVFFIVCYTSLALWRGPKLSAKFGLIHSLPTAIFIPTLIYYVPFWGDISSAAIPGFHISPDYHFIYTNEMLWIGAGAAVLAQFAFAFNISRLFSQRQKQPSCAPDRLSLPNGASSSTSNRNPQGNRQRNGHCA